MTESHNTVSPAGWYVDPISHQNLRWWNGQAWTESVAPLPGYTPAQAPPSPAPRVQQQFALPATDDSTRVAAERTQQSAAATRMQEPSIPVAQVPAHEARMAHQDRGADSSPAIPWPAMVNHSAPDAGGASHYRPQYGDALDLLRGTSLVEGSGGPDATPGYRRTGGTPAVSGAEAAVADAYQATVSRTAESDRYQDAVSATSPVSPEQSTVRPDLAFANAEQQEAAARAAEQAYREELAKQEAARLEWDRQLQAQQAQEAERLAQLAEQQGYAGADSQAVPGTTLISRRQQRDATGHSTPGRGIPTQPAPAGSLDDDPVEDVWAGAGRENDIEPVRTGPTVTWSTEREPRLTHWSTASVWLLPLVPVLGAAAIFVALTLFDAWSFPAIGVLALPWVIGFLWSQQDAARLRTLGHPRPVSALWALLTAPVYLLLRTINVVREVGRGWSPLVTCATVLVALTAIAIIGLLAPNALPAYVVALVEPLRTAAGEWF